MALATSHNAKIIIIGGKDGLPLILNTGDDAAGSTAGIANVNGASPTTASTEPSPPNARLLDMSPQNAVVPIDHSAQVLGRTPPSPAPQKPAAPAVAPEASSSLSLPDSRASAASPVPPANAVEATASSAAQTESANSPASKEPSLIDYFKSYVTKQPGAVDSEKP